MGPFAENVLPVVIYDYEGASFWEVGNVKSFEDPVALPPVLVTKIHTFDFLLAGISDANSRAAQQFLIKWQVANCVIDGMRVEVTSDDIAKAQRHSHPSMSELNLVSPFNKVVMPEATFFLCDTVIHGNVVERSDDASALSLDEEVGIDRSRCDYSR